ncbi:MAG: winged helix-turn-helix transcriptional regulator [Desulfovibrionaceae bacterium]|nr:winged helix-turn-helix transcriptional regulator [Desulfovibrionaceae bacterium]
MAQRTQIDRFRHFNRFYTNYLGLLADTLYGRPVGLTEARILYELDARPGTPARELRERLGLDKGYVSRIVKRFAAKGFVETRPSQQDARVKELFLTGEGARLMADLHDRAADQAAAILSGLDAEKRRRLLAAMGDIEAILRELPG